MMLRIAGICELIMRTAVALLCLFWFALAPVNLYAAQVTCPGDLSQVSPGPGVDLIVNGKCSVPVGQNYVFHNINVISGGILQFADPPNTSNADGETDLYAESIIVQNGGSFIAGTLKPFHPIGLNGGVVAIHLWGPATDPGSLCLKPGSNNTFDPDPLCGVPSGIWTSNRLRIPAPPTCMQSTLTP